MVWAISRYTLQWKLKTSGKSKEDISKEPIECRQLLIDSIREQMDVGETAYEFKPNTRFHCL